MSSTINGGYIVSAWLRWINCNLSSKTGNGDRLHGLDCCCGYLSAMTVWRWLGIHTFLWSVYICEDHGFDFTSPVAITGRRMVTVGSQIEDNMKYTCMYSYRCMGNNGNLKTWRLERNGRRFADDIPEWNICARKHHVWFQFPWVCSRGSSWKYIREAITYTTVVPFTVLTLILAWILNLIKCGMKLRIHS